MEIGSRLGQPPRRSGPARAGRALALPELAEGPQIADPQVEVGDPGEQLVDGVDALEVGHRMDQQHRGYVWIST